MGIRARVVLVSATAIALALAAFAAAVHQGLSRILRHAIEVELSRSLDVPDRPPLRGQPFFPPGGPPDAGSGPGPRSPHPVRILDSNGTDVHRPDKPPWSRAGLAHAMRDGESFDETRIDDVHVLVASRRIQRDGAPHVAQSFASLEPRDEAMVALSRVLLLLMPIAVAMAALAGWIVVGRILEPVERLAQAARDLSVDDPDARLPQEGDDEFGRLAGVLNSMVGRLRESAGRQRRFAADASHELRTPLAVIKTTAQIAREQFDAMPPDEARDAFRSIEASADQATRLTGDLLLLARGAHGALQPNRTWVHLKDVVDAAIGHLAPVNTPRIENDIPSNIEIETDPVLLGRIVANLVENAVRHTPASGRVAIAATIEADTWSLEVSDTGVGIASADLERLGEPFFRPDQARGRATGGAGLGIALCRTFADALGGSLAIESTVGSGTRVRLSFKKPRG